jgi:hypothetical protein
MPSSSTSSLMAIAAPVKQKDRQTYTPAGPVLTARDLFHCHLQGTGEPWLGLLAHIPLTPREHPISGHSTSWFSQGQLGPLSIIEVENQLHTPGFTEDPLWKEEPSTSLAQLTHTPPLSSLVQSTAGQQSCQLLWRETQTHLWAGRVAYAVRLGTAG